MKITGDNMTSTQEFQNFWNGRNIFITGCTGLLGSHLTESLVSQGANVTGLVRDEVPRNYLTQSKIINKINVVHGCIEDYQLIERCLNEYEIQTVFHLAAQTIVGTANRNPLSTFNTNILGTWNVLESVRRNPLVTEVLIASSDKAYGESSNLPYDENTPLRGSHPYDVSKSCADLLSQAYYKSYDLPVAITRCGNLFGGGDLNFNRLIPGTIRSIHNNTNPIIRSNGKFSRDYIYVKDAVNAYQLLTMKLSQSTEIKGDSFNFSYECPLTAIDVVSNIINIANHSSLEPQILDEAANEIPHQFLSSKKARHLLGWEPSYTFESGVRETLTWYKSFLEGKIRDDT